MWLTKHEKEVLKILLDNGKESDTSIAEKLNISTQAIGRIRKRLEEDVIKGYSINLDTKMLGLNLIAIIKIRFNNLNPKHLEEVEKEMIKEPSALQVLKLISGEGNYAIIAGFKDMEELDKTTKEHKKRSVQDYQIEEIISLPLNCLLKNSPKELSNQLIDSCGTKHAEVNIT
jgi:Lrp/AsnC family leucine-responsive transcriptional regulator